MEDGWGRCHSARYARWHSAVSSSYLYEWRWRPMNCATADAFFPPSWGVFHSSEQSFLFAPWARCRRSADGEAIAHAWGGFLDGLLRQSAPGDVGGLEWPRYEREGARPRLLIGNFENRSRPLLSVTHEDESTHTCDLWDSIFRVGSPPFREEVSEEEEGVRPSAGTVNHEARLRRELFPLAAALPMAMISLVRLWRWMPRHHSSGLL